MNKKAERFPFTVKPPHWWSYLNPFWWRRKKIIEAVMNYEWEQKGLGKKIEKAISNSILYGEGKIEVDWK